MTLTQTDQDIVLKKFWKHFLQCSITSLFAYNGLSCTTALLYYTQTHSWRVQWSLARWFMIVRQHIELSSTTNTELEHLLCHSANLNEYQSRKHNVWIQANLLFHCLCLYLLWGESTKTHRDQQKTLQENILHKGNKAWF